jgi:hypothetical protein
MRRPGLLRDELGTAPLREELGWVITAAFLLAGYCVPELACC